MVKVWQSRPDTRLRECELASPVSVAADASIADAAQCMRAAEVSCVLVGDPEHVVSVLTERDVTAAVAMGLGADDAVTAVATVHPLTVTSDATLRHAAALMMHYGVRHLVVTDGDRAVGVVSMRDALSSIVRTDSAECFVAMVHEALCTRPELWLG